MCFSVSWPRKSKRKQTWRIFTKEKNKQKWNLFHDCTHRCTKKMIMAYKWVKTSNPALQSEISLLSDLSSFFFCSSLDTRAYRKHSEQATTALFHQNRNKIPELVWKVSSLYLLHCDSHHHLDTLNVENKTIEGKLWGIQTQPYCGEFSQSVWLSLGDAQWRVQRYERRQECKDVW